VAPTATRYPPASILASAHRPAPLAIELLQIAAHITSRPAYAALVDGLNAELADWITAWAPNLTQHQCKVALRISECIDGLVECAAVQQSAPAVMGRVSESEGVSRSSRNWERSTARLFPIRSNRSAHP